MKSDAQLQKDVITELILDFAVSSAKIGVEVNKGIVTLTGHVDSVAEKIEAVRAAQRVSGVVALTVKIGVALQSLQEVNDVDIARLADGALQLSGRFPKDSVKVVVEDGKITLSGQVDAKHQRDAAEQVIHQLMGDVSLSNDVEVHAKLTQISLQSNITAALKTHVGAGAKNILVEVCGSIVMLTGTVNSWSELELISDSIWDAPGVQGIVDNIIVS